MSSSSSDPMSISFSSEEETEAEVDGFCANDGEAINCQSLSGSKRISPSTGKKYYLPSVSQSAKPEVGMLFDSVEHAVQFYKTYAKLGGFEVRKSTQRNSGPIVTAKQLVCSKQGHRKFHKIDTLNDPVDAKKKCNDKRRRPSKRTCCPALLYFRIQIDGRYKVQSFVEEHNHKFVDSSDIHLLNSSRKLSWTQQQTIYDLSKLNIGPVRAFNILREMCGGFEDVGVTAVDCKNFRRDLNTFIAEFDADMVVRRLMSKKEFCADFSCEHTVDDKGNLNGLFWADEEMKRNYSVFGDVIAFDATFRSNKYKMVFVPFTGIDNHNKNITLAAALLSSETTESYVWLLNNFQKAFGSDPKVVVTDQDPAMANAIKLVFPNSRHRLCMWHIMKKLASKVGHRLCRNKKFRRRLCGIVWTDDISIDYFESSWHKILTAYKLSRNKWLCRMYNMRTDWIPAYYRDEHMSGLMRTTSRSESANNFFGQFSNDQNTLVEFLTNFETAIECQRFQHRKNDHDTRYTTPEFKTESILERQADKIYTRGVFYDVQEQIRVGLKDCFSMETSEVDDFLKFRIKDLTLKKRWYYEVLFRESDMTLSCSCKHYERYGLLCRHIFYVLTLFEVKRFPEKYILRRWTRDAVLNSSRNDIIAQDDADQGSENVRCLVKDIMTSTEYIVNRLVTNLEELSVFRDQIKDFIKKTDVGASNVDVTKQKERHAAILGHMKGKEPEIGKPVIVKTKGSGSHKTKRIQSAEEHSIQNKGKKKRRCKNCGRTGHNSRTCKLKCDDDGDDISSSGDIDEDDLEDGYHGEESEDTEDEEE